MEPRCEVRFEAIHPATDTDTVQPAPGRSKVRRLALLALAGLTTLGPLGCAVEDVGPEAVRATTHRSVTTLRPWTQSEERFCLLAVQSVPNVIQEGARLSGTTNERAAAAANLRAWNAELREAAPPEITDSVTILTGLADLYYAALESPDFDADRFETEIKGAQASPQARRARQQEAMYMRIHCNIDVGSRDS